MNVSNILVQCKHHGIELSVKADKLRVKAKDNNIPADIEKLLRAHKTQIVSFLTHLKPKTASKPIISPRNEQQQLPLSLSQKRLWFLQQLEGSSPIYNISHAYHLKGDINAKALIDALLQVIERHENLRTRFAVQQGKAYAVVHQSIGEIAIETVARLEDIAPIYQAEREYSYDLMSEPLCRIRLLQYHAELRC